MNIRRVAPLVKLLGLVSLSVPACSGDNGSPGSGTDTDAGTDSDNGTSASTMTGPTTSASTTASSTDATSASTTSSTDSTTTESSTTTTDTDTTSDGTETGGSTGATDTDGSDTGSSGGVDMEAPTLLSGEFVTLSKIKLVFSEPMGPVTNVAPTKFRISRATSNCSYYGLCTAFYWDLGWSNDMMMSEAIPVTALENDPQDDNAIILTLSKSPPQTGCPSMGKVYPHYAKTGIASAETIADAAGNPLDDIASWWVLTPNLYQGQSYATGGFPELGTSPASIPCP